MENNTQHKAVIYCRVSTKEQVEEGNSLATQERNCREYALKQGYDIAHVFIEEGESAKTADRTELQKLLRFCSDKKQQIKAVIIYKIDRLSRNTDDYSQLRILLKRYGVEIKSTSEYFENTPAGRFMENIIANVAQFDNDVRTERSVGGTRDAFREGRYVWMAPVGYKNQKVNGRTTIVQTEKAGLVKLAFEMMAERKHSINSIRETLSCMGLPQAKSQFYKMLKNQLYMGWICKLGEKNKGKYDPIISEELFNRVQAVMQNKKMPMLYKSKHPDFPLRRFIKNHNGFKLTGAWSKGRTKKYAYYRFIQARLQWPKIELETSFLSFMDKYGFKEDLLAKLKTEVITRFSNKSDTKVKDMELLTLNKKELKEKQTILLQKNINGIISDVLLKEQLSILDEDIWALDKLLMQKEQKKIDTESIFKFISEFLLHPSAVWQKMSLNTRIKLQWFVFPEGVLFDGKIFRTTKLSSIFKLKQFFLPELSLTVHCPRLYFEHTELANNPALPNKDSVVWEDIRDELLRLEEIIHPKEEKDDSIEGQIHSLSPPWAA
jgi:site-specific DNA recombinase